MGAQRQPRTCGSWTDDDDAVLGGLIRIPMGLFAGGRSVPCTGVAGVVVSPTERGLGHAKRLMTHHLRDELERGTPLSVLYASTRTLYRRVGYDIGGTRHEASLPTAALEPVARTGRWRRVTDADWPHIERAYDRFHAHRTGWVDRGPYVWERVRRHETQPADAWILEENSSVAAWVILHQTSTPSGWTEVHLHDHGARDHDALCKVAGFLHGFKAIGRTLHLTGGPRIDLLDTLDEHAATMTLHEPWLLRVVDVPAALERRGWPTGLNASFEFQVRDEILPHNTGPWLLDIANGRGRVEPGGAGSIGIDVRGLASLYTGYADPPSLIARGLLQGPESAMSALASAFAGPAPGMPDFF